MKVATWKVSLDELLAHLLVLASMALSSAGAPRAQCSLELAPGNALPGVDGAVSDLAWWDPDGPGPAPRRLIVGGTFAVAGAARAQNIAAYDPAVGAFEPMGAGVPDLVRRIRTTPSGRLLAVSAFDAFVWLPASQIWQPIGGNAFFTLSDVVELANGDLLFMGGFTTIAGQNIVGLARFDGANWTSYGVPTLPFSTGTVNRAVELANGDLVVGGWFTQIGGVPAISVARWDGSAWHALGAGSSLQCRELILEPSGDVVALGRFDVGTAVDPWLARWDGAQWRELAPNTPDAIYSVARLADGSYVLATAAGLHTNAVPGVWSPYATWGRNTTELGPLLDDGAGGLFVGGLFEVTPNGSALRVAQWNGAQWRPLVNGTDQLVERVVAGPNGTFAASGSFSSIAGSSARRLAFFDGAGWSAVAQGSVGRVKSMAFRDSGELVVVAPFSGTVPPGPEVRRWTGSTLDLVGPPGTWASFFPTAACTARNGDVLIAVLQGLPFNLGVARWDGTSLTTQLLGPIGLGSVDQLVELANGDLVFAGIFTSGIGGSSFLVRWDGSTLQDLGVNGSVRAMGVLDDELVVAGDFTQPVAKVARFDGTSFHALGAGFVGTPSALAVLPDGDLLVDERFGTSPSALPHRVMRWDGAQWSEQLTLDSGSMGLAVGGDGTILMCGGSLRFGPDLSPYVARFEPTCPAASAVAATGCSGSVGPIALTVEQLPWLGGVLRTTTTGLAPGSLAASVYGFQANAVPLASISPFGQPGCNLACDPDILFWSGAVAGLLQSELAIPSAPALVGAVFFHQVVPVEWDASGQLAALLASDAVQLTIGSL